MNPYLIAGTAGIVLLVAGVLYWRGHEAGSSEIKAAVQTETITKIEQARQSKEKTDHEVLRTPYDDRVDGLR